MAADGRVGAAGTRAAGTTTTTHETPTAVEPGLSTSQEQERVDVVYARLDALREQTAQRLAEVRRAGPSGSPQNRSERDAFATLYEDRLAQLNAVEERLVFGRLYLRDGEDRYIGRLGLSDEQHVPILTDWRAPAAQPFYQATAAAPGDVVRRRHLVTRARRVVGVEDDVLDLDAVTGELPALSGEGALLAALAAHRTGRMGDIVATIQAEQDAVIRDGLAGVLVVQGGPGTGKTAVALHRAAFLLYAHREKLERSGVLLLGPSRVFLRYIEQVLPSLGETGVVATTLGDLLPGVSARGTEPDEVAAIKGRLAMAQVVARAVRARQRVPAAPQEIRVGAHTLVVGPEEVREAQARARRSGAPHNRARVTFVRTMLTGLAAQYAEAIGGSMGPEDLVDLTEEIRTSRDARVALNLAWMPLTAQGLVADLWAKPARLAEAAPELSARERRLLHRERDGAWTPADVPLLDEAAVLIGEDETIERAQARAAAARREDEVAYAREMLASSGAGRGLVTAEMIAERFAERGPSLTTAERAASDRSWTYGHVIVDEAQELSPMAWRAVLRRIPTRSMTVVGDLAQTSTAHRARSWGEVLDKPLRGDWRQSELTINYRTPATIMDAASAVARDARLATSPVRSARDVDDALAVTAVAPGTVPAAAVDVVRGELVGLAGGRLAVLAAASTAAACSAALDAAAREDPALAAALTADDLLSAAVVVLDPVAAKGLEFDVVVLLEPAEIGGRTSAPGGPRLARASNLYVAMTRATRRLHVVHAEALPAGFPAP